MYFDTLRKEVLLALDLIYGPSRPANASIEDTEVKYESCDNSFGQEHEMINIIEQGIHPASLIIKEVGSANSCAIEPEGMGDLVNSIYAKNEEIDQVKIKEKPSE